MSEHLHVMPRRKVCVVITARPSYSRVKSVLRAIQLHPDLDLQFIVGASAVLDRYGDVVNVMRRDGFEPTALVYMVVEGENLVTMAKSTGLGLVELATLFDNLRPDIVVTVADRYETIATAIAASYLNIPVAHIQGGEITGSIDEKVRHAVTKLSNLHFVSNAQAAARVKRMGEPADTVFVTGCPSIDLAADLDLTLDFDPYEKYQGVGPRFDHSKGYVVVLQHPDTTHHEDARAQIEQTLGAVAELDVPAFWFWPNVDAGSDGTSKGIRSFRENQRESKFHFFKNMDPEDFLRLLANADCLIGNSSAGIRECSFLGTPAVNIGERQRGRQRAANVLDVGYDQQEILAGIRAQLAHGHYPTSSTYGDGLAGIRIADLLAEVPLRHEKQLAYEPNDEGDTNAEPWGHPGARRLERSA